MRSGSRAEEVFWPHKLNTLYRLLGTGSAVSPGESVPGFASLIYCVSDQDIFFRAGESYTWKELSAFRAGEPVAAEVYAHPSTSLTFYGLRGPRCVLGMTNHILPSSAPVGAQRTTSVAIDADRVNAINALCGYTGRLFWPILSSGHGRLGDRALLLMILYALQKFEVKSIKFCVETESFLNQEKTINVFENDGLGYIDFQDEGTVHFEFA